jgi:disulfide bond formation protein DsbB
MNLIQYSTLLTVGIFAITGCIKFALYAYALNPRARTYLKSVSYETYIKAIGAIAISCTALTITYQLYYLLAVCELCWWQRIFMFPIDIVALVGVYYRERSTHITAAILAAFGTFYAGYHYYYHFQAHVLGNKLSLPCSTFGLVPGCTETPVLVFGFVTIPLMALCAFASILMLCFFAEMSKRNGN